MAVSNKKICGSCGKEKHLTRDYYITMSNFWGKTDGRMPVCKDCIVELSDYYTEKKKLGMRTTIIAICRKLDIYYCEDMYNSTVEDSKKKLGTPLINIYINKVNMTLNNKKEILAFDDSGLEEIENQNFKSGANEGMDLTQEQRSKLTRFWGEDVFDNEGELLRLHDMYESFLKNYSNDMVKREYFKLLSIEYLRLSKTKNAKDRKEITSIITSLTDKANISPKDTEQNGQDDDVYLVGLMAKKIEESEPIDYGVTEKAAYADYRGYKKYIEEYLYKPVKKAFGVE